MGKQRRAPGEGQVNWSSAHNCYWAAVVVGHKENGGEIMRTRWSPVKGKTRAGEREAEKLLEQLQAELATEAEAEARVLDRARYTLWDAISDWHREVPSTGHTSQYTADKLLRTCAIWVHGSPVPRDKRTPEMLYYLRSVGDTPLAEIHAADLTEHMKTIAPFLGVPGLADVKNTVERAIRHHMQQRDPLVSRNVAEDVDIPKAGREAGEKTFLTKEQVEKVYAVTEGTRSYALMRIGFMLGLRPGEIRALKWEHIDWSRKKLSVVKYARRGGDGKTKTITSDRVLNIPGPVLEALAVHRERWGDSEYLFTREDGVQLSKDGLRWRIKSAFRDAGLDITDPYAMRHTFASVAHHSGMKARKIANLMGHKDVTMYLKTYQHNFTEEVEDDEDELTSMWG